MFGSNLANQISHLKIFEMSEKLCLTWNNFQDNIIKTFGNLREDPNYSDVTLVCEDGKLVEAHMAVFIT